VLHRWPAWARCRRRQATANGGADAGAGEARGDAADGAAGAGATADANGAAGDGAAPGADAARAAEQARAAEPGAAADAAAAEAPAEEAAEAPPEFKPGCVLEFEFGGEEAPEQAGFNEVKLGLGGRDAGVVYVEYQKVRPAAGAALRIAAGVLRPGSWRRTRARRQGDKQGRARFKDEAAAKAALERAGGAVTVSDQAAALRLLEGAPRGRPHPKSLLAIGNRNADDMLSSLTQHCVEAAVFPVCRSPIANAHAPVGAARAWHAVPGRAGEEELAFYQRAAEARKAREERTGEQGGGRGAGGRKRKHDGGGRARGRGGGRARGRGGRGPKRGRT